MAEEQLQDQAAEPQIAIKFVYTMVNDVAAMQHFYTELLGLNETSYRNDEDFGWLVYQCGSVEFMFLRADGEMPVGEEFAMQPGWGGGTLETTSWSLEIPEDRFAATVQAVVEDGAAAFAAKPLWAQDCYWSFPVLDPMGNTVELYTMPAARPESTEWPD